VVWSGVFSPVLAFRPARVVERLGPRSAACPLSSKDLVRAAAELRLTLPLVRAPTPGVARAALVAAKQLHSVLGLSLPAGSPPEPWFKAVVQAADEVAAGLPIFLAGEVRVAGRRDLEVETAFKEAWAQADAGLTHLTVDLGAVPGEDRAEVLARVAAPALERGLGLDCVVARGGALEAGLLFGDLARNQARPDVASLPLEAPATRAAVQAQVRELLALCAALAGTPVLRRGPVTPELLQSLAGSPVAGCDDGGAAAEVALLALEVSSGAGPATQRTAPLARAEAALGGGDLARLEARAYGEVLDFLERLGATGSAQRVARVLERSLGVPPT
jgi:hypothetical protein